MSMGDPVDHQDRSAAPPTAERLASLDAYRGFVILVMLTQLMILGRVAEGFPGNPVWRVVAQQSVHVSWEGGVLIDLVQPSFTFLVGVALPFSLAKRRSHGQSWPYMAVHATWRAIVLVGLGVFLISAGKDRTYWSFHDTLSQIGLGYPILFLLGFCRPWMQWAALVAIVAGYWAAFALYAGGVHDPSAAWLRDANAGLALDRWFLNLFPRESRYIGNRAGIVTVGFVGRLATMILGLIAGGWLRSDRPARTKMIWMTAAGLVGLAAGEAIDRAGLCPIVWRLWTPSWVLWSGGWCFLFLAGFCLILDVWKVRAWAFPLTVLGTNAIMVYCLKHLSDEFIRGSVQTHLGPEVFRRFGDVYEPLAGGAATVCALWLLTLWMYRNKVFVRI